MREYPNYAQYIPVDYFKAFLAGLPYIWSDRKYWEVDKDNLPFDFMSPFIKAYNKKRVDMMRVLYLVLDESMVGWRPKTTKTGGLPHLTWEPRKPVDLGTMIRNAVECTTGIFVHHDCVDGSDLQWQKKYLRERVKSHLPRGELVSYDTAEVLRQVENSNVMKGGWTGGDAWFGCVESVVELKQRLDVFSTFIVKQHVKYFPMQILHAILVARFGSRPAGHWVVMQANIGEVDVFAMAYAWSQKGVAYIVSSCGKTVAHEQPYISKYEDEYDGDGC
jgi:hypothetical protein